MKLRTLGIHLALVAIITTAAHAGITGKSCGFMDKNQLAAWRAETMSKSIAAEKEAAQAAEQKGQAAAPAFFTGKPYLPATATYAFKYRDYAPNLARWTSEDPSGFPDGANSSHYAPSPTSQIDFMGLWKVKMTSTGNYGLDNGERYLGIGFASDLTVYANVVSSVAPNIKANSINISGNVFARCGTVNLGLTRNIDQHFTVSTTSQGAITINSTGDSNDEQLFDSFGVKMKSEEKIQGRTLAFKYYYSAAYQHGQGAALTGVTGQNGVGLSWKGNDSLQQTSGFLTLTFEAVE